MGSQPRTAVSDNENENENEKAALNAAAMNKGYEAEYADTTGGKVARRHCSAGEVGVRAQDG